MSWSFSASGSDRDSTLQAFQAKQNEDSHCPIPFVVYEAAKTLAGGFHPKHVKTISTSGHIDPGTGKGSVNISISAV
jgi:hypothetical protein